MLKFSRNKVVSIVREDQDILVVHGSLDDMIYGVEVDVSVRISDLTLLSVEGKWNRWTTPECPRAVPFLQEAVGFCIEDEDNTQKIHKIIGRKGCRHFATLLIECCDSVEETVKIIRWEDAKESQPDLTFEAFLNGQTEAAPKPGKTPHEDICKTQNQAPPENKETPHIRVQEKPVQRERKPGGVVIDLHTHTFPASPCSSVSEDHLIEEAKRIGLDGICLADHNYIWEANRVEELRQKHGFLVLRGTEITTDQGHILVFGVNNNITPDGDGILSLEVLRERVEKADGFMIAAHPFRGFLVFGVKQLGLTVENAMTRPLFKYVDAVEVMNGKVTEKENEFSSQVAAGLGFPSTGGSDAHEVNEVGIYATQFFDSIKDEKDLLNALKNRNYSPVTFRKGGALT
ncbi:PHP domain-containing protein [Desulfonema magnum]|uniref:PHP domain-containing protein, DUF2889 n=1 Tax=Desulfonema magnum TaxID=45655 RepID=A0A975GNQ2_9BACT|nr:PHP domain-containing protein [Desulfonema magnum]QTA88017.1 PHP domain-containing protein, DUF2889 [Desulfonema magnum]